MIAVLVVDDSLTVRMDLEEAFSEAGFDVTACGSVAEARQALARQRFRLALLDVVLPDGDGIELLAEIKSAPAAPPVMMLTSENEVRARLRGLQTGADEYVGKPYDTFYVLARARELIRRASSPAKDAPVVLVIDDSATFREQLRQALEQVGYVVVTAASGEEGLRTAVGLRPGAVIVDNVMTGIDGATVIRRIRQDAVLRRTPCVLLTASEDRKNEVKALEAGADAYVRKEDDIEVILTRLAAVVRSAGGTRPTEGESPSFLGPKRILAIDDSPTYLNEVTAALRDENFDVVMVSSGKDALELLQVQTVDGILCDLDMPEMDGLEVCRRIKSSPRWRHIPLLVLSAREVSTAMVDSINAGADDFVSKSADLEILKARLRAQLRRKQFEDESRKLVDEQALRELKAAEARAAQELAETRAQLLAELQLKNSELERAKVELEAQNQRVVEANRVKTEFFTNMSHELRTPLNSIIGFSEVLIDGKFGELNAQQTRYLNNVLSSGRHLLGLINDLLDQSKVEAGRLEVMREPCAPQQLTEEALATLQPLADAKKLTLKSEHDDDGRPLPLVSGDIVRLKQVLYNLLANAIKFSPAGGQVRVRASLLPDGKYVRVAVSDSGPGISAEDQGRLFTPFTQLANAYRGSGTGLGLSLSKKLVELMGGRIGIDSELGRGATFYVDLPLHDGPEREPSQPTRVDPRGPLVLIVDDEQAAQELLELALKRAGYRTIVAASAEQALALARRDRPAIITLDVFLPGIDGWDFLRILRNDPATTDIPVIMITVSTDRKKAFTLGAVEHLTKPIDQSALIATLERQNFRPTPSREALRVLAVDDDERQLELIRAELEPRGFLVRTESNAQAGLDAAMHGSYDILLLDLMMPDLSGAEIVAQLRNNAGGRKPAIMLVTAKDLSPEERTRLNQDVQAVLTKGATNGNSLTDEIGRILNGPQQA